MAQNVETRSSGWTGWIYFAGIMMIITGLLQLVAGLTALLNDQFYVVGPGGLAIFDVTTWGWVHLFAGIIVMMAGSAVLSGHQWGRVIAIILAILSFIANFMFIPAYPIWSIIVMVIDVFLLYALTVKWDEAQAQ